MIYIHNTVGRDTPEPIRLGRSCKSCLQAVIAEPRIPLLQLWGVSIKRFVSDSVPDEFSKACAALIGNIGKSKGKIRINRDDYEREDVLKTFSQLTAEHIKMAFNRIQKVGVRVLNPKAYMQTVLYNVAQMQPDSQKEDLYAQFFGDSDHRSSPSYDLEEYEKYDLFAHKPSYDLRDIEQFNIYNARACVD